MGPGDHPRRGRSAPRRRTLVLPGHRLTHLYCHPRGHGRHVLAPGIFARTALNVTVQPSGVVLEVQPGERILDAARRQGLECPHSCRNGNCEVCAATLLRGRVRQGGAERVGGEILPCLAEPLEDCELLWPLLLAPGQLPLRELSCQLIDCVPLGGDVFRLRLRAPAGKPPRYHAGQYLMLQREDGEWSAYSLASAPSQGRELELHIMARDEQPRALLAFIQRTGTARVQLPL